jgi:hypothetical protein
LQTDRCWQTDKSAVEARRTRLSSLPRRPQQPGGASPAPSHAPLFARRGGGSHSGPACKSPGRKVVHTSGVCGTSFWQKQFHSIAPLLAGPCAACPPPASLRPAGASTTPHPSLTRRHAAAQHEQPSGARGTEPKRTTPRPAGYRQSQLHGLQTQLLSTQELQRLTFSHTDAQDAQLDQRDGPIGGHVLAPHHQGLLHVSGARRIHAGARPIRRQLPDRAVVLRALNSRFHPGHLAARCSGPGAVPPV